MDDNHADDFQNFMSPVDYQDSVKDKDGDLPQMARKHLNFFKNMIDYEFR